MKLFRIIPRVLTALAALIAIVFFGARLLDGPLGPIPGGPLRSGELVSSPVTSWSFAKDVAEIELQLESQQRSRITWFFLLDDKAYVPCSLGFPPGKTWYKEAALDGRAVLRIEGKRYPVTLTKVDDAAAQQMSGAARAELERKYGELPSSDAGFWFFEVGSR
jgi:hypothetical protein